jgi:hypothetical protein
MSHQLKLNAVHFSKSLEDEKGILEASTEVLSRAYQSFRDASYLVTSSRSLIILLFALI